MILIDAIYINNGGGKVLLDFLIEELEKTDLKIYYLLDERVRKNHPEIKEGNKIQYLKSNLRDRFIFYKKNRSSFTKTFCLGNIPPLVKLKCEVMVYFHNSILLEVPKEFPWWEHFKYYFKVFILEYYKLNVDKWFVQSNFIKINFQNKFNVCNRDIKIIPFYPSFDEESSKSIIRIKRTYLYVSNAQPNKNHENLINAFCLFYDKHNFGKLILTVSSKFPSILSVINEKKLLGYPIENIGFVDRSTLHKTYLSTEFVIFPSLSESFGLGLIEGIECGCKIIGADLPYTYEVCEPSIVFNPLFKESILSAFEKSISSKGNKQSIPKIKNNINELINILLS